MDVPQSGASLLLNVFTSLLINHRTATDVVLWEGMSCVGRNELPKSSPSVFISSLIGIQLISLECFQSRIALVCYFLQAVYLVVYFFRVVFS